MKSAFLFAVGIVLLSGCDRGPSKEDIQAWCADIGDRAYYAAKDAAEAMAAQAGAIAECKLKYLTKR